MRLMPTFLVLALALSLVGTRATAATGPNVPLYLLIPTDPITATQVRQTLEQSGFRMASGGPIGTNPGAYTLRQLDPFSVAYRAARGGDAQAMIIGMYWSDLDAREVLEELALRTGVSSDILRLSLPTRTIPGTEGRYVEVRLPFLEGHAALDACAGPRTAVYIRDLQSAAPDPRAHAYLGATCGPEGWGAVVDAVSVDTATFTASYVLHGVYRSVNFTDDPRLLYGDPFATEPAVREAVLKIFPNDRPERIRVFAAHGVGRAYVWRPDAKNATSGRMTVYEVAHAGEVWKSLGSGGAVKAITWADFSGGGPSFETLPVPPPTREPYF